MSNERASTPPEKHRRWLAKAEHYGEWVRFSETELAEPERVWLMKGGNGRCRFYAVGRGQVGPEHAGLYPASLWAWANRWLALDPFGDLDILGQLACRKWVLDGGAQAEQRNEPIEVVHA